MTICFICSWSSSVYQGSLKHPCQLRYRENILEAPEHHSMEIGHVEATSPTSTHIQKRGFFSSQTNLLSNLCFFLLVGVYTCEELVLEIARFPKGRKRLLEHDVCTSTCHLPLGALGFTNSHDHMYVYLYIYIYTL